MAPGLLEDRRHAGSGGARDDRHLLGLLGGHLGGEVRDLDPVRAPGGDPRLDRGADVVDVDVDVPEVGPTDDEQRVAQPVEGRP